MRRERIYQWLRGHPVVIDSLTTAVLLFIFVAAAAAGDAPWVLVIGQIVPLAVRRKWPVAAFGIVAAVSFIQWLLSPTITPSSVSVLIALYAVAAYAPAWASRLSLGVSMFGVAIAVLKYVWLPGPNRAAAMLSAVLLAGLVIVTWLAGDLRRVRHEYVEGLVDRAAHLERERDQQARLATAAERARIAREMHDVVAHSLSMMVVQADGGRYAADQDPPTAKEALETISKTGREALAEMRRLLGVLRAEGQSAELAPQPGLDRLDRLVEQSMGAGVEVDLVVEGTPRPVERGVDLAAYRTVQEALTNVVRHGGPGVRVKVHIRYDSDCLLVRILDDGRGAAGGSGAGHGLLGMRERATAYGGSIQAGPRGGGGWIVQATFPDGRQRV